VRLEALAGKQVYGWPSTTYLSQMEQLRPIVSQRAATIILALVAGLAVFSFVVAGITVFENPAPTATATQNVAGPLG
jgi:hypothetical protein